MTHGLQCWCVRGACCPSLLKQLVILSFAEVSTVTVICCFQLVVHWNVLGWYECSTDNKPRKQVCARTCVSWACMSHGVQCLCVRGACCPSLLKQLIILSFVEVSTVTVICCYQLDVHWNVPGCYACSLTTNLSLIHI